MRGVLATLLVACGGSAAVRKAEERAVAGGVPLERVEVDERPALTLLARTGDPRGAIAFVGSHARGSQASAALLGLLVGRMHTAGMTGLEGRAHGLGVELSRRLDADADIARFIHEVHAALAAPVRSGEPALREAQRRLDALAALRFVTDGERAAAACSGELGLAEPKPWDVSSRVNLAALEAAREAVFRVPSAAFAVLGPARLLEAATQALGKESPWPARSADAEVWPEGDSVTVDSEGHARSLTFAVRVPDADKAISAGLALGQPGSLLLRHLQALNPPWRLQRASAIARRRGGCLRFDVVPASESSPDAAEAAEVVAVLSRSASLELSRAQAGGLDESVVRPADPLTAATLAAWRALPSTLANEPAREVVAYSAESGDHFSASDLERALRRARSDNAPRTFELLQRAEAGQGELWMLLAGACGTSSEQTADAGALALALRTAARTHTVGGVRLEPWISTDGVGLIAHAPRKSPLETPDEQAERVAQALGEALAMPPEPHDFAAAREELLRQMGGHGLPAWSLLLDGLAPNHPSWIEPHGTFQTLTDLQLETVERARRALLKGPLRLAVLANRGETQGTAAAQELDTWLATFRRDAVSCPSTEPIAPRRGELLLDLEAAATEAAYIGLSFVGSQSQRAAELGAILLNRPEGVLTRALAGVAGPTRARARLLGGQRATVLVIELHAAAELQADAVSRVRSALDQLARSGIGPEQQASLLRELEENEEHARFDPRRRLIELARPRPVANADGEALRPLVNALAGESQWLVRTVQPARRSTRGD